MFIFSPITNHDYFVCFVFAFSTSKSYKSLLQMIIFWPWIIYVFFSPQEMIAFSPPYTVQGIKKEKAPSKVGWFSPVTIIVDTVRDIFSQTFFFPRKYEVGFRLSDINFEARIFIPLPFSR